MSGGAQARKASDGSMAVGSTYYRECRYVDDGTIASSQRFVYRPATPAATPAAAPPVPSGPSLETIVQQVYAEVPLVLPQPHTSPPVDAVQLVGFPMWMWVDGTVWRSFDASASVAGVSVSVVARPKQVVWTLGDGAKVTCKGPGTAWNPAGSDGQRTDCSHIYQFVSRYQASVTMTWSVSWSASTGQAGVLPDASRSTAFGLTVSERQAVIHYGGRSTGR